MILRSYERTIFKRYLLPHRGEGFIFVAAAFSFVAVTLGVAALVIVMSVVNGVRGELFDKIVGLNGHAVVQGFGGRIDDWRDVLKEVRATPGVTEATPAWMKRRPSGSISHQRPPMFCVRKKPLAVSAGQSRLPPY